MRGGGYENGEDEEFLKFQKSRYKDLYPNYIWPLGTNLTFNKVALKIRDLDFEMLVHPWWQGRMKEYLDNCFVTVTAFPILEMERIINGVSL